MSEKTEEYRIEWEKIDVEREKLKHECKKQSKQLTFEYVKVLF